MLEFARKRRLFFFAKVEKKSETPKHNLQCYMGLYDFLYNLLTDSCRRQGGDLIIRQRVLCIYAFMYVNEVHNVRRCEIAK